MSSETAPSKQELIQYYQRQDNDERRMYGNPLGRNRHSRRLGIVRRLVERVLRPTDVVLDLGCGDGFAAGQVLDGAFPALYVGVDLSAAKLHATTTRPLGKRTVGVVGDAERLPLADETTDCVMCLQALEHMASPLTVLTEIRRVLRPGGICVVTVPVGARSCDHRGAPGRPLPGSDQPFEEHVQHYTDARVVDLVTRSGLSIVAVRHSAFSLPVYNRIVGRLPYSVYTAVDSILSRIPVNLRLFKGLNREQETGIGRQNLVALLRRPATQ